jgi:hypothetical protein
MEKRRATAGKVSRYQWPIHSQILVMTEVLLSVNSGIETQFGSGEFQTSFFHTWF